MGDRDRRGQGGSKVQVTVEGHRLTLSHLDKAFYPQSGFTKGHVIDYYLRVAPALLPHLRGRPLTFKRYPEGAGGPFSREKRCPSHRPRWMKTAAVWNEDRREEIHFCLVDDLASLLWAANLANLELLPSLSLAGSPHQPTMLVYDLDPGPPADLRKCCEVALLLRALLAPLGLASFPKTSGARGLQVCLPLHSPVGYGQTQAFARATAEILEERHPGLVASRLPRPVRAGKVLVDWSQNARHQTTVCAYSLRAMRQPTVSTPVLWDEVEQVVRTGRGDTLEFDAGAVLDRVRRMGDLFTPVLSLQQHLPHPFHDRGASPSPSAAKR